jgi:hypothetical protein
MDEIKRGSIRACIKAGKSLIDVAEAMLSPTLHQKAPEDPLLRMLHIMTVLTSSVVKSANLLVLLGAAPDFMAELHDENPSLAPNELAALATKRFDIAATLNAVYQEAGYGVLPSSFRQMPGTEKAD